MEMLIAAVVILAFAVVSALLFNHGIISKRAVTVALGLALIAASVLYWISERAA